VRHRSEEQADRGSREGEHLRLYLEPRFKDTPLDKIDVSAIAQLRADLGRSEAGGEKRNNILAVLSEPLHYTASAT
jgi:hypothetical protein